MNNKYFKFLLIALIVAIIVPQITLASWWNPVSWGLWGRLWGAFHKQTPVACTMEAKLCPDGSSVGRQGPKCEFKDCPNLVGGDKDAHGCIGSAGYTWCEAKNKCLRVWEEPCETDQTADWKTYTNTQYGFEIKYPSDWKVVIPERSPMSIFSALWEQPNKGFEEPYIMTLGIDEKNGKTVQQWLTGESIPYYNFIENAKIDSIDGVIAKGLATMGSDFHVAIFPKRDYMFFLGISSNPPEISEGGIGLLKKVISTFKFTK